MHLVFLILQGGGANLSKFTGSSSISSDDYFGRTPRNSKNIDQLVQICTICMYVHVCINIGYCYVHVYIYICTEITPKCWKTRLGLGLVRLAN